MAWYNGTFKCGHEGTVEISSRIKSSEREKYAEYKFAAMVCPDCYKKQMEAERAQKQAAENEELSEIIFPDLEGSEKQIAWAEDIRRAFALKALGYIKHCIETGKYDVAEEREKVLNHIIRTKTSAKHYIDNRERIYKTDYLNEIREEIKEAELAEEEPEDIKEEYTVVPETCTHNGVVEITGDDKAIFAKYEKNEDFRRIVKDKEFVFDYDTRAWRKPLGETTGVFCDRAAEMGNILLNQGFAIRIFDDEILKNAVAGNYEPEHERWIMAPKKYPEFLTVTWNGKDDRLYNLSRRIKGFRYMEGYVRIPLSSLGELEDFAELEGFQFTERAKERISEYRNENAQKVLPAEHKETEREDKLKKILESSGSIIDDLKDE